MAGESAPIPVGQTAFGERYLLDLKARLPEFDTAAGEAYIVKDSKNPDTPLYGLVHNPGVPIRNDVFKKTKGGSVTNLVAPVDRGLLNIQFDRLVQRLVTVFERPTGGPLFSAKGRHEKISTAFLRTGVTLSVVRALAGLHKKGILHRSIHPAKMYFLSEDSDEVYLGECCTAPAGQGQPDALDPIEVVFADDSGRGEATVHADYFQLGAALVSLYLNSPIWEGRDRDSLLIARVNQSSYWALTSGQDVPGALGSLVKGLLADEIEDRWSAEDVLNWFEGSVANKRSILSNWAMSRPTNFKGTSYVDRRLFAYALASDPKAAGTFLRTIDFQTWMHTSLRDEVASEKLERLLSLAADSGGLAHEANFRLVTRFCYFLHPTGPIHFKGIAVYPDAIPTDLANAFATGNQERVRVLAELLSHRFLGTLSEIAVELEDKSKADKIASYQIHDKAAKSASISSGMERVLYDLNPTLPCLSVRFDRNWVGSLKQLLRTLDRMAEKGSIKGILMDRHISAFVASHAKGLDKDFNKLIAAKNDPGRFNALTTEMFGFLQGRLKMEALPHLTGKLVDGLSNGVKSLKNKKRREQVQIALEKMKKGGDIAKLSQALNLPKIQAEDARDFSRAKFQLQKLDKEKQRLSQPVKPSDPEAQLKGYNGSRNFSAGSLFLTILMVFI